MSSGEYDEQYFRILGEGAGRAKSARATYWAKWLARHRTAGPVLEVGSGDGAFAVAALRQGLPFVASDISSWAAERCARLGSATTRFDAVRLPVRTGAIGAAVAFDVLEHMPTPQLAVRELWRTCGSGAPVVVSVPNPEGFGARTKAARGAWFAQRDATHCSLLPRAEWIELFKNEGFTVRRSRTDFLWDCPYDLPMPKRAQRPMFLALQVGSLRLFGGVPGTIGENLIMLFKRT